MAALLLACALSLTGCSGGNKPANAENTMVQIKYSLKKAERTQTPETRIQCLRHAYDNAELLKSKWPDAEKVPVFLKRYRDRLSAAPNKVCELSRQTRDLDSFKWAVARSAKVDTQHSQLLKIWKMGKQWRDFFISEYPEKTLSLFMSEAVNARNTRFFNQYIEDFKVSGYRLEFPLEETEFNARFCRFLSIMLKTAMQKGDTERIVFLLGHMPARAPASIIDQKTQATMRSLGDYVCHGLKDEKLACKLVEMGYDMGRVDLAKTGFGNDFSKALNANPKHAVTHILKLDEWHGELSPEETEFLLTLPDPLLRLIHKLHIAEAIETPIKNGNTDVALQLIKIREEINSLTIHDYDQILGWALEYENSAIFDYLKAKSPKIDLFMANLAQLGETPNLFRLYAPEILKKIYKTMDKRPMTDGTTLGRIRDLLVGHHPEAVLYVVKNYDLADIWVELTGNRRTLLMEVCEGGNLEAAKYLVEKKGANIRAQTDYTEPTITAFGRLKGKEGRLSPIFFAAKSGNSELIEYLASKKASVNARSAFGATPLMHAVSNSHPEAVKMLVSLGAKVNARMNGNLAGTPELMELGAYRYISTAYRRARKKNNAEILSILKEAGAKPY